MSVRIDYFNTGTDGTVGLTYSPYLICQTFKATQTCAIYSIKLRLDRAAITVGQVAVLDIYATSGGLPLMSSHLGNASIAMPASYAPAWYEFTFSSPINLNNNTTYALVLSAPYAAYGIGEVRWLGDTDLGYSSGVGYYSDDLGANWYTLDGIASDIDFYFETYTIDYVDASATIASTSSLGGNAGALTYRNTASVITTSSSIFGTAEAVDVEPEEVPGLEEESQGCNDDNRNKIGTRQRFAIKDTYLKTTTHLPVITQPAEYNPIEIKKPNTREKPKDFDSVVGKAVNAGVFAPEDMKSINSDFTLYHKAKGVMSIIDSQQTREELPDTRTLRREKNVYTEVFGRKR
jgi:hypothetical protein